MEIMAKSNVDASLLFGLNLIPVQNPNADLGPSKNDRIRMRIHLKMIRYGSGSRAAVIADSDPKNSFKA